MRIEQSEGWWIVARGKEYFPHYFSFFVDSDGTSWTKYFTRARKFITKQEAEDCLGSIRERQTYRRKERTKQRSRENDNANRTAARNRNDT